MPVLDHVLWGAPDLDPAVDAFASLTGVAPGAGGSHPGFGTRNQLLAIGPRLFFEVIAPDPAQAGITAPRAQALAARAAPSLSDVCLAEPDLEGFADKARAAGLSPSDPVSMSRTRPDGVSLSWRVMHLSGPEGVGPLPFLIDWKESQHPAETVPGGASLLDFTVLTPNPEGLQQLYTALGIDTPVAGGVRPGFVLRLDTPRGQVVLT